MNTTEDLENAPIGATATAPNGKIAIKTGKSEFEWTVYGHLGHICDSLRSDEMVGHVRGGFTLNAVAPTTAREALELAWELAYPVEAGQTLPDGTRLVLRDDYGMLREDEVIDGWRPLTPPTDNIRTLDRLPNEG